MIVKVLTRDNRTYLSYVFATDYDGFFSKLVVFDSDKGKFEFINMYERSGSITRKVFIIDDNEDEFVEVKVFKYGAFRSLHNVRGYAWLVNNGELFKNVLNGLDIDAEYTEKAFQLNQSISTDEWTLINDEKDIKSLLVAALNFHDGTITNVNFSQENVSEFLQDRVEVTVSGCWGCDIVLAFELDTAVNFSYDSNYCSEIFDASIFFENGFFYFVDRDVERVSSLTKEDNYFRGRTLKWKHIVGSEQDIR